MSPETEELITRLRSERHLAQGDGYGALIATSAQAADLITALLSEVDRLRGEMTRLSYVPLYHVAGHADDCSVNYFEPCDCGQGIVEAIKLAFNEDLKRILSTTPGDAAHSRGDQS